MQANRRTAERMESVGLMTNLFDGRSGVLGLVEDISRGGLRVSAIPRAFEDGVETCYAVVNGGWRDFHLALRPRWAEPAPRGRGVYKRVGFQILHPPIAWMNFIKEKEDEQHSDMVFAA